MSPHDRWSAKQRVALQTDRSAIAEVLSVDFEYETADVRWLEDRYGEGTDTVAMSALTRAGGPA